jgi:putative membrane protein
LRAVEEVNLPLQRPLDPAFALGAIKFGQQMVTDHTGPNNELGKTAQTIGLQVPTDLSSRQQAEFQALSKTSGRKFDAKYANLMVKDHTDDLAVFKKAGNNHAQR